MILQTDTTQYEGKILSHFETEYGEKLKDLIMCDSLVIVFSDGAKIILKQDWRGQECYFSQKEESLMEESDITACTNNKCPSRLKCYRFTVMPNPYWQAYAKFTPDKKKGKCENFWNNKGNEKKT